MNGGRWAFPRMAVSVDHPGWVHWVRPGVGARNFAQRTRCADFGFEHSMQGFGMGRDPCLGEAEFFT
jgi:hypothetical protein